jgi:hypothetical protein
MEATDILYVNVEFKKHYDPMVFPNLPQGFEYWSENYNNEEYCGIVLHDVYPVHNATLHKKALSGVVAELRS